MFEYCVVFCAKPDAPYDTPIKSALCACSSACGRRGPCGPVSKINAYMDQIPGVLDGGRMTTRNDNSQCLIGGVESALWEGCYLASALAHGVCVLVYL